MFQPHTFTRTRALFNDFVESFDKADKVLLLDIYAAREDNPGDVSSALLCDAANRRDGKNRCRHAASFDEAADIVKAERQPRDLIFTVGAGDVDKLSEKLL